MKRLVLLFLVALAAPLYAQPVPPSGLRKVATDTSLFGTGTALTPIGLMHCISTGQSLVWNNTSGAWACGSAGITGTITSPDLIVATGASTVGNFGGSAPAACAAGTVLTQVTSAATGAITLTCTAIGTAGGTTGTGTTNTIPKWTSTTGFGNSSITDNGTTVMTSEQVSISRAATASPQLTLAQSGQKSWALYEAGSSDVFALWNNIASDVTRWDGAGNLTQLLNFNVNGNTTLGDASTDTTTIHGTTTGVEDGTWFAWDDGSARMGFTKKATFTPKLTYGSATTFAISESSGTSIAASNTFTDRLTIDTAGNVAIPSGTLSMGSHQINLVTDPTLAQDAATKNYVDTATTNEVTGTLTSGKMPVATGAHAVGDSIAAGTASGITIDNGTATNVSQLQLKRNAVGNIALTNLGGGNEYIQFGAHYDGTNFIADDTTGVNIGKYGAGSQLLIGTNAFQTVGSVTSFQNRALLNLSTGALELTGAVTLDSTLHTVGAVTLDSTLGVTGATTLTGSKLALGNGTGSTATHVVDTDGTSRPTLTNCGTTPTIVGDDNSGYFSTGSSNTGTCTLTFKTAFTKASCIVISKVGAAAGQVPAYDAMPITTALNVTVATGGPVTTVIWQCADH